ncbi:MAG TPA: sugar ABC transporter substrate-binding protein [Methylomirabilota bacterium]|nr:sugar ABC transporter substrate-binding protein [Methylomirabilota bacterium]
MKIRFENGLASTAATRRAVLRGIAGAAGLAVAPTLWSRAALAQAGEWTMVLSMRSVANPYHATFAKGGENFAKSIGAPYEMLVTEGNSEKGIADIKALLARTGGKMVLNVDPNDSPDARIIVEAVKKAGGYVVTQWNKPDDLHPWDHDPNYVAHMSFDGVPSGKAIAQVLIDAMGGSGGIVAIGGILSNVPAIERKLGLDQAIADNAGVTLLDYQAADWNETKAYEIMQAWLTRYGADIKGVWAANDGMAIGALEALRQEGLAGSVPVTGIDGIEAAYSAIGDGEMAGTVAWDPMWTGGIGLALGYAAASGEIDIAAEPHEHREFYGTGIIVTKENVDSVGGESEIDFKDYWGKSTGQIQYRS